MCCCCRNNMFDLSSTMKVTTNLEKKGLIQFCGLVSRERANSRMNCMTIVWWATWDIKSCFWKHKITNMTTSYNHHATQHQLIYVTCKTPQVSEQSFFQNYVTCEATIGVEILGVKVIILCKWALNVIGVVGNSTRVGGVTAEVNQKHGTNFRITITNFSKMLLPLKRLLSASFWYPHS